MYSQFIHGKLVSNRASGYQLVARSADLTNEANLKTMAEGTHRFWGSTPPENPKVVGIFLQGDNLVLVKAETAMYQNGQLAVNGDRGFNQHRYVFIPVTSMSALQGRAFKLFLWMFKQPIPLLTEFNANLEPLSIPVLEDTISAETREREVEKIQQCWQNRDQENPLILSALAVIINGKRLLFTNEQTDITPQNWIESILVLLPASIRPQVSVAFGTLEEQQCTWAQLVVKINQHSSRSLPENMIWLNRANQTFQGQADENTFENSYVDYIRDHITTAPETLKQLIQQLDQIADKDLTLESLAEPKVIVRLIPALPEEQQDDFLTKYLSGLNLDKWEALIPLIIKADYQQGLVFAWKELGKNTISESQQYIPLMLLAWSSLVNAKLVLLLDELKDNLALAEILLKQKLLEQPRPETEDTDVERKLILLCKSVVAERAKPNWLEAWEFATHLATHQLFHDEKEAFSLLDTALLGEISTQNIYNFFTLKLTSLFPHIEEEQFRQSNLYQQLTTKNQEAAKLLATLLLERNAGLAKLLQIAKLIEMKSTAKDNLYEAFLKTWSPSKENARPLLVAVIKENQNLPNNFSRDEFSQTYTWFEKNQPELKEIFESLQQNPSWDNWNKLAQAVHENSQEQTEFLDSIVGNIFPIDVMQKWLPLIVDDENVRKKLIDTSLAWKSLKSQDLNKLVAASQLYVTTLTRCLRDSDRDRFDWIEGDLLHYLCQAWIRQKRVDEDLRNFVTSPRVTNTFTNNDWLNLQRLSWEPEIELELPLGVKTALTPDLLLSLQNDAKTIVAGYTCPEQTRRLLNDCLAWGLVLTKQKEILEAVQPQACNADLIMPYLYREDKVINPAKEKPLIGLLLQLELHKGEKADVEKFSVDVFTQHILPNRDLSAIQWWREKATDKQLYNDAFYSAAQKYVHNISITDFSKYLTDLKKYSLVEECKLMFKGAFYWIPDNLISPIIDIL